MGMRFYYNYILSLLIIECMWIAFNQEKSVNFNQIMKGKKQKIMRILLIVRSFVLIMV
jgi:hypothetical protein